MLLSIIIPVYNASNYIDGFLTNIESSIRPDYEVVFVDDGSTDDTLLKLERYKLINPKISVFHQENSGPSIARKTGLDNCAGKYVMFVDVDDEFSNDFFTKMLSSISFGNYDIVECGYYTSSKIKKAHSPQRVSNIKPINRFLNNKTTHFLWDKIYKRELLKLCVFPHLYYSEDAYILLQAYAYAQSIGIVRECLYTHYVGGNSLTGKFNILMMDRIHSGILMIEFLNKKCPKCSSVSLKYYVCKYSAKNSLAIAKYDNKNSNARKECLMAFFKYYSFWPFLLCLLKCRVSIKSFCGIIFFRFTKKRPYELCC